MSVLSKILDPSYSLPYNCYEMGHFWTPHCSDAAFELLLVSFVEALKIYSPLYLASQIIFTRKYSYSAFKESAMSVFRSSAFLATNVFTIPLFLCMFRHQTGKFYCTVHSFIPIFTAAMLAIAIEKPSRRFPLAVYVANIASECMFRIGMDRGYITAVPKGEVILFTASISVLLYLVKKQGYGLDPISLVLRYYLGKAEAGSKRKAVTTSAGSQIAGSSIECSDPAGLPVLDTNSNLKKRPPPRSLLDYRHESCKHEESSCVSYAVSGFLKPFLISWFATGVIASSKKYRQVVQDPSIFTQKLFSAKSVSSALFFGSFSGIYKAVNCVLRHHSNGVKDWHALVAGLMAGPTMLFQPNATITLYVLWKLLETLYWEGEKAGYCKNPNLTAKLVYSVALTPIAYCLIMEPRYMRPSYMRFIDQLTGHRFHVINRLPLNVLLPAAVHGYEDYFPDLSPKLMSNKFMESMFVWLI